MSLFSIGYFIDFSKEYRYVFGIQLKLIISLLLESIYRRLHRILVFLIAIETQVSKITAVQLLAVYENSGDRGTIRTGNWLIEKHSRSIQHIRQAFGKDTRRILDVYKIYF